MKFQTLLKRIAKSQGLRDPQVYNCAESTKGCGYISDVSSVRITGKDDKGEDATLNLVVKMITSNEQLQESAAIPLLFNREIFMYSVVFPAFQAFIAQTGASLAISVPKCHEVVKQEALIFEDLKQRGFETWNRNVEMGPDYAEFVLKEYGRLHALSFAVQDQEPELFLNLTESLDNTYDIFLEKTGLYKGYVDAARRALKTLDPQADKSAWGAYRKFLDGADETLRELMTAAEEHQVILHGDCWFNNMMFRYDETGKPVAMRLLDFQMSRIGSPVADVVYFLYICCAKAVLDDLDLYMRIYYDSLSDALEKLGSSSEKVYPFSVFEQHWAKYARLGLVMAAFFKYLLATKDDELVSFADILDSGKAIGEGFAYEIANINRYYAQIRNVIVHCVDRHFI